jgi:hypothetical protein
LEFSQCSLSRAEKRGRQKSRCDWLWSRARKRWHTNNFANCNHLWVNYST